MTAVHNPGDEDMPELDKLEAGDEVTLFPNSEWEAGRKVRVDRVTETLTIIGGRRFWRKNSRYGNRLGHEVSRFNSSTIMVGEEADIAANERQLEIVRNNARREWRSLDRPEFSQEAVSSVRVACDRAETALRQLGEWNDIDTPAKTKDPAA